MVNVIKNTGQLLVIWPTWPDGPMTPDELQKIVGHLEAHLEISIWSIFGPSGNHVFPNMITPPTSIAGITDNMDVIRVHPLVPVTRTSRCTPMGGYSRCSR